MPHMYDEAFHNRVFHKMLSHPLHLRSQSNTRLSPGLWPKDVQALARSGPVDLSLVSQYLRTTDRSICTTSQAHSYATIADRLVISITSDWPLIKYPSAVPGATVLPLF